MGNGFCRFWSWGEFFMKRKKKRIRTRWNIKVFVIYAVTLFFIIFGIKTAVVKIAELIQGRVEAQSQEETDVTAEEETEKNADFPGAPPFTVDLLDINEYSRPGIALEKINGIVIHYTANPKSTAKQNRDYFEGLKDSHETKASSHFVVGIKGEIVQCIPSSEISYASNSRNSDTLSIECCHKDKSGKFTKETYQSLVELVGWLCQRFGLTSEQVIRHYDVTGKNCPKYFVEHEDEWEQFKKDVDVQIAVVEQEVETASQQ